MKEPIQHFRCCPCCGKPLATSARPHPSKAADLPAPSAPRPAFIQCAECGFLYHFNPTVAAGAILARPDGTALFVRRARDPAKGKLALPGGFIEIGETAEVSLRREILEEVGLEVGELSFLCSEVNFYDYRTVRYPVLDLFFTATVGQSITPKPLDDVAEICWVDPRMLDFNELAFPSVRAAVRRFVGHIIPPAQTPLVAQTASALPPVPGAPPPDNRSGQ